MGWTSYHAQFYKSNGNVDRKAEMDNLYTWESNGHKVSVVKSRMVGSIYYAAIKVQDGDDVSVIGTVALTCGKDRRDPYFNFGYKAIEETSGPYCYDCPTQILNLLTPTDNEYALAWRKKCREKAGKPKLSDLPVGSVISFTTHDGRRFELTKMAPNYQFKRTWWYNASNDTYTPSKRIPSDWELKE